MRLPFDVDSDSSAAAQPAPLRFANYLVIFPLVIACLATFSDALAGRPITAPEFPERFRSEAIHWIHLALLVLPAPIGIFVALEPAVTRPVPGEVVVDRSFYLFAPRSWWQLACVWPAIAFAAYYALRALPTLSFKPPEVPETVSARGALLDALCIGFYSIVCFAVLLARENLRATPDALLVGLMYRIGFPHLTHAVRTPLGHQLYHHALPERPIALLKEDGSPGSAFALEQLARHNIPAAPGPFNYELPTQLLSYTAVAAIFGAGFALHHLTALSPRAVIFVLLLGGIGLGLLLDKRRGIFRLRQFNDQPAPPRLPTPTSVHA